MVFSVCFAFVGLMHTRSSTPTFLPRYPDCSDDIILVVVDMYILFFSFSVFVFSSGLSESSRHAADITPSQ